MPSYSLLHLKNASLKSSNKGYSRVQCRVHNFLDILNYYSYEELFWTAEIWHFNYLWNCFLGSKNLQVLSEPPSKKYNLKSLLSEGIILKILQFTFYRNNIYLLEVNLYYLLSTFQVLCHFVRKQWPQMTSDFHSSSDFPGQTNWLEVLCTSIVHPHHLSTIKNR